MVTGVRLEAASQSMIYHHLKGKGKITRQATSRTLRIVEETTKEMFGLTPTTEAIWRSMRHGDISKKIRDLLWKHAHGIYRLGTFWDNIDGYEERGTCPLCQQPETFGHELWKIRYQDDITHRVPQWPAQASVRA